MNAPAPKTSLCFLLAAKRCEMADLQQLAQTSGLVRRTAALIHELQRERGLSNLYAASLGQAFVAERRLQLARSDAASTALRAGFDTLDTAPPRHGARLYSRIAFALHGLETLPRLRLEVEGLRAPPASLTAAYTRLIASLLAVVFEAADTATDLALSRRLVALFHLMQGKELAGQERATGSAMLATGRADGDAQQRLLHLIESQDRCLQVFETFADEEILALWQASRSAPLQADIERLRRQLCNTPPGQPLDSQRSATWFDTCSQRMDEMRQVEERLTDSLAEQCQSRLRRVADEMHEIQALQARLDGDASALDDHAAAPLFHAPDPAAPNPAPPMGLALEKSVLELVQEQATRLQALSAELETVRASLNERKLIERAKGLLMAHQQLSEEAAHKALRDLAMRQNKRMVDVAEAVLSMATLLSPRN